MGGRSTCLAHSRAVVVAPPPPRQTSLRALEQPQVGPCSASIAWLCGEGGGGRTVRLPAGSEGEGGVLAAAAALPPCSHGDASSQQVGH